MCSWLFWKYKCKEENYADLKKMEDWHGIYLQIWWHFVHESYKSLLFFEKLESPNNLSENLWTYLLPPSVWLDINIVCKILAQVPLSALSQCKNDSHELLLPYTEQILRLFNSWTYNHTPTHKPAYWSLPSLHNRAVNTTDTSCCTKTLLSILYSNKTPKFTEE
jgi:hypothetical protein